MQIYSVNLKDISRESLREWFEKADKSRQDEVLKLKTDSKRIEKIAADRLRRTAISDCCKVPPESIRFSKDKNGKPYAVGMQINFNISHSAGFAVCAVSENEIGIDIEKIRSVHPRAAEKFACPHELDYIKSNENGFFEIWTLKEAYFKCIGTGLGKDIKEVSFEIDGDRITCSDKNCECSFIKIADGYVCSVCKKI